MGWTPVTAHVPFYTAALRAQIEEDETPTPAIWADRLEALSKEHGPPGDLPQLLNRLRGWPPEKPYPRFPDDATLLEGDRLGGDGVDPRWSRPGTRAAAPLGVRRRVFGSLTRS